MHDGALKKVTVGVPGGRAYPARHVTVANDYTLVHTHHPSTGGHEPGQVCGMREGADRRAAAGRHGPGWPAVSPVLLEQKDGGAHRGEQVTPRDPTADGPAVVTQVLSFRKLSPDPHTLTQGGLYMARTLTLVVAFLVTVAAPVHAATLTITHGEAVLLLDGPDLVWNFSGEGFHDEGLGPNFSYFGDITVNGQHYPAQCDAAFDDCDGTKPLTFLNFSPDSIHPTMVGIPVPFTAAGQYHVLGPTGEPVTFDITGHGFATLEHFNIRDSLIRYTFTTPEPTTMGLLALGVGLAFSASRRITRR